ncbi:hypothetical protein GGR62_003341 [Xanthomonas campestris]|nr:hypothetical protein [Xanthomonas sp. 3075]
MHWLAIVGLALALAGCSCQRTADQDAASVAAAPAATPAAPTTAESGTPAAAADAMGPDEAATRANFANASATVQRYLGALPGSGRAQADALWTGGRPPPMPDDAVLRGIGDIRSMRIDNDSPVALDQQRPPRLIEVPVRVIVRTGAGTQQLVGAYRLQPRAGSDSWEIYSATLQPVLR